VKGCADEVQYVCEEKGALFKYDYDEDELPDLSAHNTYLTDVLKAEGGMKLWKDLKGLKTALGVKLTHCLKTGMDNPGHPQIKTVGLVAGDEESFTLFKTLLTKSFEICQVQMSKYFQNQFLNFFNHFNFAQGSIPSSLAATTATPLMPSTSVT
jgi:hypothetical protein